MKALLQVTIGIGFCSLVGCKSMSNAESGSLVGGGMGAVAGTAIGAATDNPRTGAVVGALGGALVGNAVGQAEDQREIAQATYERQAAASRLGITDVVSLCQQGIDPEVVVNQIRSTGSSFSLSTADIQYLTQQNVPARVITAMQTARPISAPPPVIVRDGPAFIIAPRPHYHHWGHWGHHCRHW